MANSEDFSTVIATALGINTSDVASKLEGLTIEQMNNLINATIDGNTADIKTIVASTTPTDTVNPLLSDPASSAAEQQPTEPSTAPAPPSAAPAADEDLTDSDPEEQTNEGAEPTTDEHVSYKIGDEVMVGDTKAVVKKPNGPNDTVGCVLGGVLRMIKKKDIRRCNESIVGAAEMQSLLRMQALAGITPDCEKMPFQISKIRTSDIPSAPETQAKAIATATNFGMDENDSLEAITDAFSEIALKLPDIKQGDVKTVRQMTNSISDRLNEKSKPFSFFKSLAEGRSLSPVSHETIVNRVRKIGYSLREADDMVSNYLDVLGHNANDEYANIVVKQAISSLNKKRGH